MECCSDELKANIIKTADNNNFLISSTTLEIEGKCSDCLKK